MTKEQDDCQYCYEDTVILKSHIERVILEPHEQDIIIDDGFSYPDDISLSVMDTIDINYCPMCGRKLIRE